MIAQPSALETRMSAVALLLALSSATSPAADPATIAAIEATCHDYVDGQLEGDPQRVIRSLHPDLAKRAVLGDTPDERLDLRRMSKEELVALTKQGALIGPPGTPREMPISQNPSGMAEDFALQLIGTAPVSKLPMTNCPGCWRAQLSDGGWVTYRPAGQASQQTSATAATVEINSPRVRSLNASKGKEHILKLKFPVVSEVP